jgi:hypothetical protein
VTVTTALTSGPEPGLDVTVAATGGGTMTAVTLWRLVGSTAEKTRLQPATGGTTSTVTDFELPWGVPVSYRATITTSGGTETLTSAETTVDSTIAWLIHPNIPSLSLPLDQQNPELMGIVSLGDALIGATSTVHQIIGANLPVVTWVGPRLAPALTATVATVTVDEQNALFTILNDQTPLLVRFPTEWGVNWADGYYHVGDVTVGRVIQYAGDPRRTFTLPLTPVAAPAGLQAPVWDYPTLAADFDDYPSMSAAFADYPSLTANVRLP